MSKRVMVELQSGYSDGYGVACVDEDGRLLVNAAKNHDGYYRDEGGNKVGRMEEWKRKALSSASVDLESGVRVPTSAIASIIGPIDCPESARIRAKRYTAYWRGGNDFVAAATDEEIVAAMGLASEQEVHAAMRALRIRYSAGTSARG